MKFILQFDCDNATFDQLERAVAYILQETMEKMEAGKTEGTVYDMNGSPIGKWGIT